MQTQISTDPNPTVLLDGLVFPEAPRWHAGRLWLADWGAQELIAVAADGTKEVVVRVPSFPFGFDWLPDGTLLVVSARQQRLLRLAPDGTLVTHVDLSAISTKPWNEIVADGRGNVYVNNIGFDFPQGEYAPGSIALVTPDGAVRQVADGLGFPNGMVVTPDNRTLIVAESYGCKLTAYDIAADGSLANPRCWADVDGGAPDGICLDAEGAVWYADVPHRHCRRVREGGQVLQTVSLDRGCFACMLGGADRRTLYITANEWSGAAGLASGKRMGQVVSVAAPTAGAGWPAGDWAR